MRFMGLKPALMNACGTPLFFSLSPGVALRMVLPPAHRVCPHGAQYVLPPVYGSADPEQVAVVPQPTHGPGAPRLRCRHACTTTHLRTSSAMSSAAANGTASSQSRAWRGAVPKTAWPGDV